MDISFWSQTFQMLSLHLSRPYLMWQVLFPLTKYWKRKKLRYLFSHLPSKRRHEHMTQAPPIRCITLDSKYDLLDVGIPNSPLGGVAAAGVAPWRWGSRDGDSRGSTAAQHQWCWELMQQYLCPDWWQKCLWDHFCVTLSCVLGGMIFKPTLSQHAQRVLNKTHILLMN